MDINIYNVKALSSFIFPILCPVASVSRVNKSAGWHGTLSVACGGFYTELSKEFPDISLL